MCPGLAPEHGAAGTPKEVEIAAANWVKPLHSPCNAGAREAVFSSRLTENQGVGAGDLAGLQQAVVLDLGMARPKREQQIPTATNEPAGHLEVERVGVEP